MGHRLEMPTDRDSDLGSVINCLIAYRVVQLMAESIPTSEVLLTPGYRFKVLHYDETSPL